MNANATPGLQNSLFVLVLVLAICVLTLLLEYAVCLAEIEQGTRCDCHHELFLDFEGHAPRDRTPLGTELLARALAVDNGSHAFPGSAARADSAT